ncbi:MAG: hypothetical protein WAP74_03965 [Patescibacteria group bacterium]
MFEILDALDKDTISLIGGIVGLFSVPTVIILNAIQAKNQRIQAFMQIMNYVNRSYSEVHETLNTLPQSIQDYHDLKTTERLAISRYINLCFEEWMYWKLGMLHKRIWPSWRQGIAEKFNHPVIKYLWQTKHRDEYDIQFQHFIDRLIKETP